jgi:hypothetical protein
MHSTHTPNTQKGFGPDPALAVPVEPFGLARFRDGDPGYALGLYVSATNTFLNYAATAVLCGLLPVSFAIWEGWL